MLRLIVSVFIFAVVLGNTFGMTKQQLKKTLSIMKKQCMQKFDVTEAKVGNIDQGVFIEDHDVMCYIACVYKTAQTMKNNKLNRALVLKQVDILYPPEMKAAARVAVDKCIDVQDNYDDMCEAIFYAAKCLYDVDPDNFVFP